MRHKPVVGIFASPFINLNKNYKFNSMKNKLIMVLKYYIRQLKQKNINYIIIPYNLNTKEYDNYLNNIDGLYISGNFAGIFEKNKEIIKQYKTFKLLLKKVVEINKTRIFPIYGNCHGYGLIIKANENVKYNTKLLDKNFDAGETHKGMYKSKFMSNTKKYKKYNNRKTSYDFITAITPKKFAKTKKLKKYYNIISVGKDRNHKKFVDFIKHKTLPFYLFKSNMPVDIPEIFQEYIDDVYKSNKIRKKEKLQKQKFKPKTLKYKTYKCNKFLTKKISNKSKCILYEI